MAVTTATLRLAEQLRRDLAKVDDRQTQALASAWADAWDEVAPDLTAVLLDMLTAGDKVTRAQLLRSTRLRKVLALIADELDRLCAAAGVTIIGDLQVVIDTAGGAQASIIDSQLPAGSDLLVGLDAWSRVDARQIAAIVVRSTQQITSTLNPIPADAYAVVRRELIRGVASGSNPRQTAARMVKRAETKGFNLALSRALNVARTETLDAYRAAAEVAQDQHTDILAGWEWLAKLDARTCRSCWAQHGRRHDLTEAGPHDHQQGRCARLLVTKSWAELGLDVEEPDTVLPDPAVAFDALSPVDKLEVLGPSGYAAWVRGEYPLEAWTQRRENDGWRPSYVVTLAPRAGQASGGRSSRSAA